jgi:ribonuclease Y
LVVARIRAPWREEADVDPMQMLIVAISILGTAVLVLAIVFSISLRQQQAAARQAARRALEDEGRTRALKDFVPRPTPKAERKPRTKGRPAAAAQPPAESRPVVEAIPEPELTDRARALTTAEARIDSLTAKLGRERARLEVAQADLDRRAAELVRAEGSQRDELARIAGLDPDQARAELLTHLEREARLHSAQLVRDLEADARRNGEARAREIIVSSIQRLAAEQTTETVVTSVPLPSDEMKGRIIRAFEQVTGVNLLIDDTPESALLSCFDPVRRETARLTLTELVQDGRIHPARIEEVHERSKRRIDEQCLRAAEDALIEMGITDLDPGLLPALGALRYRTSYGQNVLAHLVESGHIAALMAGELGLNVETCRRAAFLHDIGKALTHEVEGSHALVGAQLARRYGEHPDIVHAIEAHHNEVEPRTVEAVLTQAADAISGSRPGARRESLEIYVKRLERLEEIARAHAGVDKVFAMQAGREVRVMVQPEHVSDAESQVMARDIARQVEGELTYPGSIKVTVVRESRAVAVAH